MWTGNSMLSCGLEEHPVGISFPDVPETQHDACYQSWKRLLRLFISRCSLRRLAFVSTVRVITTSCLTSASSCLVCWLVLATPSQSLCDILVSSYYILSIVIFMYGTQAYSHQISIFMSGTLADHRYIRNMCVWMRAILAYLDC